jgi:hypothetical protein
MCWWIFLVFLGSLMLVIFCAWCHVFFWVAVGGLHMFFLLRAIARSFFVLWSRWVETVPQIADFPSKPEEITVVVGAQCANEWKI